MIDRIWPTDRSIDLFKTLKIVHVLATFDLNFTIPGRMAIVEPICIHYQTTKIKDTYEEFFKTQIMMSEGHFKQLFLHSEIPQ